MKHLSYINFLSQFETGYPETFLKIYLYGNLRRKVHRKLCRCCLVFRGKCNVNSVASFKIISRSPAAVLQYEYWQIAWSTLLVNKFVLKKLSLFGNWRIIAGFTELAINPKPVKQSTVSAPSFHDPDPKLSQAFIFCWDENVIVISRLLVCVVLRPFYNSSFHYFSSMWLRTQTM